MTRRTMQFKKLAVFNV